MSWSLKAGRDGRSLRAFEAMQFLEPRVLLAVINWDGGGDGTTLTQAQNWAGDVLPGPADDAVINVAGTPTVTHAAGTFNVQSLTLGETMNMSGGTLTVAQASSLGGSFTFSGGTISGAGTVTFTSLLTWSGGSMTGSGQTVIGSGTTANLTTSGTKGLGRTLVNNGTINHSAGALRFLGNATLSNSSGRTYAISGTAQITSAGTGNSISNAGVFRKDASVTVTIAITFNNTGALNLVSGILNLDGGGTNSGARNILSGTTLNYRASYTHAAGSTLAGSGSVNFDGGTQTISGNWTANTFLKLVSGTLTGAGTLTTTGPFFWLAGTMTGSGSVVISGNGKLAISTSGSHVLSRNIVNDGVLHYLNGTLSVGGTTITNNAGRMFALLPAATITVTGGTNIVNNAGTMRKLGPDTITFDAANGGLRLNNTGLVDVRNGILSMTGALVTQVSGTTLTGGSWQIYPVAELDITGVSIRTIGAGASLTMVGADAGFSALENLEVNNGTITLLLGGEHGVIPFGGTFVNNGVIDISRGATVLIDGGFTQGASGVIRMKAQGATAGLFSRVQLLGPATLGGTIEWEFVGGFDPGPGVTLNFITGTASSGQFATTTLPTLSNRAVTIQYFATGARLTVQ